MTKHAAPVAYEHINSAGKKYYLHTSEVKLRGGTTRSIYFFAGTVKEELGKNPVATLPEGYEVMENSRTKLPMLRKIKTAEAK